jgi:phosphotransacetylase
MTTPTQPIPPPELDEAQREDARRQVESNADGALDLAGTVVDAITSGAVHTAGTIVNAALDATVTVAKVSVDVVGGLLGGLGDL